MIKFVSNHVCISVLIFVPFDNVRYLDSTLFYDFVLLSFGVTMLLLSQNIIEPFEHVLK